MLDRLLYRAWNYLNPRWRAHGGPQLKPPRIRAIGYNILQAVEYNVWKAINNWHFDGNHPERWQK